jgi:pimeloyl-ACP methyl ester carboxylesterase
MPYAEVDGLRLYYERAGSGQPELLLIHGWCSDRTAFRPQFEHFAQTHAVTALDLRGCGESDRPADGYTIPDFADDLAQFCAKTEIDKPVVAGHSLGGMIAVELAARHPSVPRALVLVDPGPMDPLPETVEFFREFAEQLDGPRGEEERAEYLPLAMNRADGLPVNCAAEAAAGRTAQRPRRRRPRAAIMDEALPLNGHALSPLVPVMASATCSKGKSARRAASRTSSAVAASYM